MKPEDFFTGKQQLGRYKLIEHYVKKLFEYKDKGYLIFREGDLIHGKFEFRTEFGDNFWDLFWYSEENCQIILIDIEYDDMGYPWIMSKESINKEFKRYAAIDPKEVKSIF